MATLEQQKQLAEETGELVDKIASINPPDLVRRQELGAALSFEKGLPFFRRTLRLFRELSSADLSNVPHQPLQRLKQTIDNIANHLDAIEAFDPEEAANPADRRDSLVNQIRDSYHPLWERAQPILGYSFRARFGVEEFEQQADEILTSLKEKVQEQETAASSLLQELETVKDEVQRTAQEVGVAKHAAHFKTQAEEHQTNAETWLGRTTWLGLSTLAFAVLSFVALFVDLPFFSAPLSGLSTSESIQVGVTRFLVFTFLLAATVWAGRIYKSHLHNYVINKHRQNALNTFETFAAAANDDQTKSAVLLQATQSIFAPQLSGYVSQEGEAGLSPKILEIIRQEGSQP